MDMLITLSNTIITACMMVYTAGNMRVGFSVESISLSACLFVALLDDFRVFFLPSSMQTNVFGSAPRYMPHRNLISDSQASSRPRHRWWGLNSRQKGPSISYGEFTNQCAIDVSANPQ
ncbi:hypothetical protein PoB_004308000 [Plakobranchus ocellatus]|uniref:SSD domain-containing protein n=1 Tax=Plakobranchus ocellatus TaxID=259542 RepID=A0AAV4BBW6_9GAST|nr:hypothetical protein PoB_004308000 [Plakobranchus ocellatus]